MTIPMNFNPSLTFLWVNILLQCTQNMCVSISSLLILFHTLLFYIPSPLFYIYLLLYYSTMRSLYLTLLIIKWIFRLSVFLIRRQTTNSHTQSCTFSLLIYSSILILPLPSYVLTITYYLFSIYLYLFITLSLSIYLYIKYSKPTNLCG